MDEKIRRLVASLSAAGARRPGCLSAAAPIHLATMNSMKSLSYRLQSLAMLPTAADRCLLPMGHVLCRVSFSPTLRKPICTAQFYQINDRLTSFDTFSRNFSAETDICF